MNEYDFSVDGFSYIIDNSDAQLKLRLRKKHVHNLRSLYRDSDLLGIEKDKVKELIVDLFVEILDNEEAV